MLTEPVSSVMRRAVAGSEGQMDTLSDPKFYMPDETKLDIIRERIVEYNSERPAIYADCVNRALMMMIGYGLVAGTIAIAGFQMDLKGNIYGVVLGLTAFVGYKVWEFAWKPVHDHQSTLRYRLFPVVFSFIDGVQYSHGHEPSFLREINDIKLVRYNSSENDDLVTGTHEGLDFALLETKLIVGSGKHKQTVFAGLMFHCKLDKAFPGLLVVAKRGNWLQRFTQEMFRTGASDLIASGDPALDETHEFHSDNYSVAKPLIEGPLAAAIHYLSREWTTGEVRIALRENECFLLLPSDRNYFALPDVKYDVDYQANVEPMIREMVVLLAVAHMIRKVG
jgi:hypothetical protein